MKRTVLALAAMALTSALPLAHAHEMSYHVMQTFYEPDTQPKNTYFIGSFDLDTHTGEVSNLKGKLSESMTGSTGYPGDDMSWLDLNYQLKSSYDSALGGWFVTTFRNSSSNTFWTGVGGDGWSPQAGVDVGGVFYGFPSAAANPGNAYAMIFVPDNPLAALTQAQIDKLAYADCAPGGMMGSVCMTGSTVAGYGAVGTMGGYPVSQLITAVPEPQTHALLLGGLALVAAVARRRRA